jgi:hypothetical protein
MYSVHCGLYTVYSVWYKLSSIFLCTYLRYVDIHEDLPSWQQKPSALYNMTFLCPATFLWIRIRILCPYLDPIRINNTSYTGRYHLFCLITLKVLLEVLERVYTTAKFIFPDWGHKVESCIGLSYRPARLHRLTGRGYDNPYAEVIHPPFRDYVFFLLLLVVVQYSTVNSYIVYNQSHSMMVRPVLFTV